MADSTRSKTNIDRIEDAIACLCTKLEDLCQKVSHLETSSHSLTLSTTSPSTLQPLSSSHHMKLDVPCFDGSNPFGWIFKINQIFAYHETPKVDRLTIASFLYGRASVGMVPMDVPERTTLLLARPFACVRSSFSPSQYNDPSGTLFKLTQRGTVNEYLTKFESLANHIIGLPPAFLISCFIFGLTPEIC
ncbi:hypothetical protein HKD37_16G045572 [Glycine soja]